MGADPNPFRYCGEYFDVESGAYYLRARYYDPSIGRFTQEDGWDGVKEDCRTHNEYTYCINSPIAYYDPTGYFPWLILLAAAGGGLLLSASGCGTDKTPYFDFTSSLLFEPTAWNSAEYRNFTNCYAYAFNMIVNPVTGKKFPFGGMQPGMLSGKYKAPKNKEDLDKYITTYLAGTLESNQALVSLITADMDAIGLEFVPYEEGMTGGYVVALAVSPGKDYHWYRQEADGSWSHKPGQGPAMQNEVYITDNGNIVVSQNMITDPEKAAKASGYTVFIGYFYVREKKEGTK